MARQRILLIILSAAMVFPSHSQFCINPLDTASITPVSSTHYTTDSFRRVSFLHTQASTASIENRKLFFQYQSTIVVALPFQSSSFTGIIQKSGRHTPPARWPRCPRHWGEHHRQTIRGDLPSARGYRSAANPIPPQFPKRSALPGQDCQH